MHLSDTDWTYIDERAEHFIGREWVFERIRSFLASDARLLVIAGPPGTGKTAIASRLAQASADRLADDASPPIPHGTIDAAVLCRVGQVSVLGAAQDLADQLSTALEGFAAEQRSTVAAEARISDIHAQATQVLPGGNVIGVKVDLARLGPERAFADGLALPLRRLSDRPDSQPPVLLVDSLDEAYASPVAQVLPGLLAGLMGTRLIVTTRDDPRVLGAIGLEGALATGRAATVHLIRDAPPGIDEVAGYAAGRLRGRGSDGAVALLAGRIGVAAEGNFLYAYHVIIGLLASSEVTRLDDAGARDLPLPTGGLTGVYRAFIGRDLGGDEDRWQTLVRPILAPLAVALGDGLDTAQLAAIGSVLTGRPVVRSTARDVSRRAGQFLDGPRPDGPFRVYHRSFADFLLDPDENPDWPVDASETHAAIVEALAPSEAAGSATWSAADAYARTHIAEHAAACGRLDDLLTDPGFLVVADLDRLLPLLWDVASAEARETAAVVQVASADLRGRPADERGSYLELAARMRGADAVADRIATLMPDRPWSVPSARWHSPRVHVPLVGHEAAVDSVAIGLIDGRPVAVSGGWDGTVRVWDLRTLAPLGEPLTGHVDWVPTVAVGLVDDRPVAVSGGDDGTVRLWDLRTLAPVGEPLTAHDGPVRSVAIGPIDGRPVVVSGGLDGTVRVWDLRTFAPLGEPLTSNEGPVRSVALGQVDRRPVAVSGSRDQTVRVWDLRTMASLGGPMTGHEGAVISVAVGMIDERPVAVSGGWDGTVRLWDLRTLAPMGEPGSGHNGEVLSVAVGLIDGKSVAVSGGDDGTVRVWDLRTLAPLGEPMTGHEGSVSTVAVGQVDGRPVVLSGSRDRTVRVWDLRTAVPLGEPPTGHEGAADSLAAGQVDGRPDAVSGGPDRRFRAWDPRTGVLFGGPVSGRTDLISTVAVGQIDDRPVVLGGSRDGRVRVWDLRNLEPLGEPLMGQNEEVLAVAVVQVDGRPVAVTGGVDGTVRVWDLRARAPLGGPLTGHEDWVSTVAVGEIDGRPVAVSGGKDESVRVWDLRKMAPLGEPLTGHRQRVTAVAVGQVDGRPVAVSGAEDRTVRVWDLRTVGPLGEPLTGVLNHVESLAVGEVDGQPVAVGGDRGGDVRVWDLRTLSLLGEPMTGHEGLVLYVAVGLIDGRPVAVSGGFDGTVRVWDLTTRSQRALVSVASITGVAMAGPDRIVVSATPGLLVIRFNRLASAR